MSEKSYSLIELNKICLQYDQGKAQASDLGKGLRHWQNVKPQIEQEIKAYRQNLQISLFENDLIESK